MNPQTMFITGQDGKPVMINTVDFDAETMTAYGVEGGENAPPAPPVNPPDAGQPVQTIVVTPPQTDTVNPGDTVTMPDGNTTTLDAPQPVEMFVGKKGKKFIVTNKDGEPIEAEGIEAAGYGTEAEAWSAIMARNTKTG